jgi:hypothetical protein
MGGNTQAQSKKQKEADGKARDWGAGSEKGTSDRLPLTEVSGFLFLRSTLTIAEETGTTCWRPRVWPGDRSGENRGHGQLLRKLVEVRKKPDEEFDPGSG